MMPAFRNGDGDIAPRVALRQTNIRHLPKLDCGNLRLCCRAIKAVLPDKHSIERPPGPGPASGPLGALLPGAPAVIAYSFRQGETRFLTKQQTIGGASHAAPAKAPAPGAMPATDLLDLVSTALDDAKAEEIVIIDLTGKSAIADAMVVASGRSDRHVGAVADRVLRTLKEGGYGNVPCEGLATCDWVLIDAGDIIVHIFRPEVRSFYNLEKMWAAPALEDQSTH
jgi:ribosome-associated protein